MLNERSTRVDIVAIGLLAATLFIAVSLFTYDRADRIGELVAPFDRFYQADVLVFPSNEKIQNACGFLGALTADALYSGLGLAAYFVLAGMIAVSVTLIYRQAIQAIWSRTIGWVLALVGVATLFQVLVPDWSMGPVIGSGGYVGALTKGMLGMRFAFTGTMIVSVGLLVAGLLMWTDYMIVRWISWMGVAIGATVSYLVPLEWFQRGEYEDDSSEEQQPVVGKKQSIRKRRTDDLKDAADAEVESIPMRKSILDDYADDEVEEDEEGEEEIEEVASDEDEWDVESEIEDEEEEFEDDVEDVDAPQTNTIPFILKTAAKNALIPKSLRRKKKDEQPEKEATTESPEEPTTLSGPHFSLKKKSAAESPDDKNPRDEVIESLNAAAEYDDAEDYQLPGLELLTCADEFSADEKRAEAIRKGKALEKAFHSFGLKVRVVDFETGPVITQFELDLDPGLRLSKITGLGHDIAIALRVPSVRVVAPIPGKNTVGVEVPNDERQTVRLREVIEDSAAKVRKMKIPLFLGKDVAGDPMIADLASLPHLLIAGRTGTGKSVCLNAIISSILMTRRPDEVRMLMIDPKMVELSGYGRLPHLMHPVVTDMRKAEAILAWAVDKMEERYKLLAKAGVRHVSTYNQLSEDEILDRLNPETEEEQKAIPLNLPFIVIVADEIADLMMTAGKEVEQHIIRLAQKSRAVGIHLILATQKPTVDVITGLIKSNLPARISFQVASRTDSRVVLDEMGAEKLLGNGDMLFLWPGTSTLHRGQGTFLSDDEIRSVTDEVSTAEPNFVNELVNLKVEDEDDSAGEGNIQSRDEKYFDAVETVIKGQRGSISLIQKNLGIGYGRAARLVDYMEEDGIVGTYAGSKSREILITMEQWERMKNGGSIDSGSGDSGRSESVAESSVPGRPKAKRPKRKRKNPVPVAVPRIASTSFNIPESTLDIAVDDEVEEAEALVDDDEIEDEVVDELDVETEAEDDDEYDDEEAAEDEDEEEEEDEYLEDAFDDDDEDEIVDELVDEAKNNNDSNPRLSIVDVDSDLQDTNIIETEPEKSDDEPEEELEADEEEEDVEYEYEYVDEEDLDEGEDYEIEYHYVDEEEDGENEEEDEQKIVEEEEKTNG